jgi:hypothetical protein
VKARHRRLPRPARRDRRRRDRDQARAGSTNGAPLAAQLEKFKQVRRCSGPVSFSRSCTPSSAAVPRDQIQNNKAKLVGTVTAKVVPKI